MSRFLSPLLGLASRIPFARRVYGPGYRRARAEAFRRSGGVCQVCGSRRAEEAHHWALRYPADADVTADDLTAVCRRCHGAATFRRLLDRLDSAGLWVVLAIGARPAPRAPRGGRPARQPVPRRQPRHCHAPERPATQRAATNLRVLVEQCRLTLFVGCLACGRFVRLDRVAYFQQRGWDMSVAALHRRLCCCKCRSHTQWVLLGGSPVAPSGPRHS